MTNGDLYVGLGGTVLALDPVTGTERWRRHLKGLDFVNVALVGTSLVAATKGEVFGLDPSTGQVLWHNKLKGLGRGFVTFVGAGQAPPAMASQRRKQDAAVVTT